MKKFILSVLFIAIGVCAFAQDEEKKKVGLEDANSTDANVVGQVIREDRTDDFCHWSLSLGGGFNLMLVERNGTQTDPLKSYRDNFQGAGYFNVGYMINPIWGIVAEYGFLAINKKIYSVEGDQTGYGHEATLQLDFNILNLVRKCRKDTKWNVDMLFGAGFLAYNTPYKIDEETGEKKHYYYPAAAIPVTLQIQYCPTPQFGISLRITGKWYSEDNINYIDRSAGGNNHNNDLGFYCGLGLHYNITHDGKSHVRVTDRCTYEPMNVVLEDKIVEVNEHSEQIKEMQEELQKVQDDIAVLNGAAPRKPIAKEPVVEEPVKVAQPVILANNPCCDTIKKIDDKCNAIQEDVDDVKKQLELMRQQVMMTNGTEENIVYFDFNSAIVKSEYQLVIAKVARNMLRDKDLKVDLISNCDKEGSSQYNNELGKNRALAVYFILVNRYKIDKNRINIRYDGQILDQFNPFNRRCYFVYK